MAGFSKVKVTGKYKVFKWETLTTSDRNGDWLPLPYFDDITVFAFGTFGASAAIAIEGSPQTEGTPTLTTSLGDVAGSAISMDSAGTAVVGNKAMQYRPVLTDGDVSTDVDVYIVAI